MTAVGQNASCRTAARVAAPPPKPDAVAHESQPTAWLLALAAGLPHLRKQPPRPTAAASDSGVFTRPGPKRDICSAAKTPSDVSPSPWMREHCSIRVSIRVALREHLK
jgi:hypothetical protein